MEEYDEKINYLGVTTNIHGGWIKTNNSDKFYEVIKGKMIDIEVMVYDKNNNNKLDVNKNGLCYKYVRYIDVYKRQTLYTWEQKLFSKYMWRKNIRNEEKCKNKTLENIDTKWEHFKHKLIKNFFPPSCLTQSMAALLLT